MFLVEACLFFLSLLGLTALFLILFFYFFNWINLILTVLLLDFIKLDFALIHIAEVFFKGPPILDDKTDVFILKLNDNVNCLSHIAEILENLIAQIEGCHNQDEAECPDEYDLIVLKSMKIGLHLEMKIIFSRVHHF